MFLLVIELVKADPVAMTNYEVIGLQAIIIT